MKTVLVLTSKYQDCSENVLGSYHSLISGLKLNRVRVKTTGSCRLLDVDDEIISEDRIIQTGKDKNIDLIILMFVNIPLSKKCEDFAQEPYLSKALEINRWEKTVYIDYYERSWRNVQDGQPDCHTLLLQKCQRYFKRELTEFHLESFPNIRPYPLSYLEPNLISTLPEKKYDIFCSFPQTFTGLRKRVVELCHKLQSKYNVIIKSNCNRSEYLYYIQSSWITLDAKGAGEINNRFFEIISNRSMCVRQKYTVKFYQDYAKDMVGEYNDMTELEKILDFYLDDKQKIIKAESLAYRHYRTYHTSDKVVSYLLTESQENL